MAKVTGPLYSMSASGSIGKAMVHFTWKGISVVREWIKPTNTKTSKQGDVRLILGGIGQATRCVGLADATHEDSLYGADAKVCAPTSQTWNSFLVQYVIKNMIPDASSFESEYTAYSSHSAKDDFESNALLLELADFDVPYKGTTHSFTAGFQLYLLGRFGIAMRTLKEGVFNRAPYNKELSTWGSADVTALKNDLLQVTP